MMRKLVIGLICSILLAAALALLTGALGVVKTHGNSMAPRITEGDLVIVRSSTTYEVGDVVAYRSAELDQVVLHRIIAITDGRYAFRGITTSSTMSSSSRTNNSWARNLSASLPERPGWTAWSTRSSWAC